MEKRYILTAVLVCFLLITTGIWWAGRNYKLPPISGEHEVRKGISLKNGDAVRVDGEIKKFSVTKTGMMFVNMESRDCVKLTVIHAGRYN